MSSDRGKLTLVLSCMFGGKTSFLMHTLETSGYVCNCLYINHTLDTRGVVDIESGLKNPYSTHNKLFSEDLLKKVNATIIQVSSLKEVESLVPDYDLICIDEAQFFEDLVEYTTSWVDLLKKNVYIAGLSGDSKRKNFGEIHKLLPHADNVIMLRGTFCGECAKNGNKRKALFTYRIKPKVESDDSEQIQVGGLEKYIPACRECYITFSKWANQIGYINNY